MEYSSFISSGLQNIARTNHTRSSSMNDIHDLQSSLPPLPNGHRRTASSHSLMSQARTRPTGPRKQLYDSFYGLEPHRPPQSRESLHGTFSGWSPTWIEPSESYLSLEEDSESDSETDALSNGTFMNFADSPNSSLYRLSLPSLHTQTRPTVTDSFLSFSPSPVDSPILTSATRHSLPPVHALPPGPVASPEEFKVPVDDALLPTPLAQDKTNELSLQNSDTQHDWRTLIDDLIRDADADIATSPTFIVET